MLAKEFERAGLPTAHICSIVPVAEMLGSNRIIEAYKVVSPVGNPDLRPKAEKKFRRSIVEKSLEALGTDLKEQTVFGRNP